jgi:transcriptional regulator of NAD metabolism
MAIDKLLAIWQFLFTIKDQLHTYNIFDTSKDINVQTRNNKKSNKKA